MTVLKDFTDIYLIGQGGFAKVYRAISCATGEEVAIKFIEKCRIEKDKFLLSKVTEEISIQRQLIHESIVKILDVFETKKYICIVLEYCSHGDIQSYLQRHNRKGIRESEAATLLSQIIDGLTYLHHNKIVHRDLKAANILLDNNNHPKIADFGLSTDLSESKRPHMTMCGTPSSMAPEVWARNPYGLEVDVWGLGVILYFLLFGCYPSDRLSRLRVQQEDIEVSKNVSLEAQDLLKKMLRRNQRQRITVEEARTHPFFNYSYDPMKCDDSGLGSCSLCLMPRGECHDPLRLDSTRSKYGTSFARVEASNTAVRTSSHAQDSVSRCMVDPSHSSRCRLQEQESRFFPSNHSKPLTTNSEQQSYSTRSQMNDTAYCSATKSMTFSQNDSPLSFRSVQNSTQMNSDARYPLQKALLRSASRINTDEYSTHRTPHPQCSLVIQTDRLLPCTGGTQKDKVHIGKSGEVFMERVQSSGLRIFHVLTKDEQLVTFTSDKYTTNFPDEAKYTHRRNWTPQQEAIIRKLASFVKFVRDRTVKITYYDDCGESFLMESSPDVFSVRLLSGELIEKNGDSVMVTYEEGLQKICFAFQDLSSRSDELCLRTFIQLFDKCLELERMLETSGQRNLFPAVFGRKRNKKDRLMRQD